MNLRKLAQGQQCQVRIEGVCSCDQNTTVLHHIRMSGVTGMGMKANDLLGAWVCSSCHSAIHGQIKTEFTHEEIKLRELEGVIRTQAQLIQMGVL